MDHSRGALQNGKIPVPAAVMLRQIETAGQQITQNEIAGCETVEPIAAQVLGRAENDISASVN
jgi:hypothetical protein